MNEIKFGDTRIRRKRVKVVTHYYTSYLDFNVNNINKDAKYVEALLPHKEEDIQLPYIKHMAVAIGK